MVIEKKKLIFSDVGDNHNKWYEIELLDDDTVISIYGRVGYSTQTTNYGKVGRRFFDKKVAEKFKKGYTELRLAGGNAGETATVANSDLHRVAKEQIKGVDKNPELQKLIDRLVRANVHKITSSTNITYNDATGLFSTPLGIVTQDAIDEARNELVSIKPFVEKGEYDVSDFKNHVNGYLRLIPQNVGMKLNTRALFPDVESIKSQNDILDSLESSLQALIKQPTKQPKSKEVTEKVFEVSLNLLEDGREIDRIRRFFGQTSHRGHVSSKLKIVKIYTLTISSMAEAFEEGKKLGNVMELWHGTKKANLLSILKVGLRVSPPNTVAITGKMFGNGIYFSDQSTKSLNYAYGYWDGNYEKDCFMLLNDVAMGKYHVPSGGWGSRYPIAGYDSVYAQAGKSGVQNNEMIVYKNNQVNIKFLVEFSE